MSGATCGWCGWELTLPRPSEACLDEHGGSHVRCDRCHRENVFAGVPALPGGPPEKSRRGGSVALLMWLIILGMVMLMLPSQHRIEPPRPETPRQLLV